MPNAAKKPARPLILEDPATLRGKDKSIGGSQHDGWNLVIANHVINSLRPISDEAESDKAKTAAVQGLIGINPKDELKGMLPAQLVACHHASMECYRRAMLREQTFEGRQENLNRTNKLSRTYSALLESLNRHRGKGQQKMTVEHVHVYEGGQAIVGNVETRGGGFAPKTKDQPHAPAYSPGATMRSPDTPREPMPVACDAERSLPDARRKVAGSAERE